MLTNKATRAFELKELTEKGTFEGLVSVYGNVDFDGDIIEKGAFEQIKKTSDGKLRIAAYHDTRMFVGKAEVTDTDEGLYLKGKLNMALSYASDIYELMKDGIIGEMSVGFRTLERHFREVDGQDVNVITKGELWEGSLVPFAANEQALITGVKSIDGIKTRRDFEKFLRESGFSRKEATRITNNGFENPNGDHSEIFSAMLKEADNFNQIIKGK